MSLDFKDKKSPMDYQMWAIAHTEPVQNKSGRFMTLSAIVHAGLILAAAVMTVPITEKIKTETISIEIEEPLRPIAQGVETVPTQGSPASSSLDLPAELPQAETKVDSSAVSSEDVIIEKPTIAARLVELPTEPETLPESQQKISTIAKAELKKPAPALKAATKTAADANPVKIGPPAAAKVATIDDIEAPEVDTATEEVRHSMVPTAYSENLDKDLESIDDKQSHALAEEKNKIDQEADAVDAENDEALENVQNQTQKNIAALEATNTARRERDAQAIANALAKENAAREAAAAKHAAAVAVAQTAIQQGAGDADGDGAGSKGLDQQGPLAGTADGVRSLDQLRQMPGNPIPQYSNRERLDRQSGVVTYHAYVKKDGTLSGFRQVGSTGYANLDSKTLNALQQWRFYPGQEGWVELPFSWDLKGGAQSVDGLLRTKRSDLSGR